MRNILNLAGVDSIETALKKVQYRAFIM